MSKSTNAPGAAAQFPSTHWSRIAALEAGTEAQKSAWESLATAYWKPVYAYVRLRWARSDEDALDCTQEFFVHLLEGSLLARADPHKGRFRAYVKTALANFVHDLERKRRTLKRGGERVVFSLAGPARAADGSADEESSIDLPETEGRDPDDALDDVWRAALMETATRALESELDSQGKAVYFRVFREYFLSEVELDYASVAERFDLKTSDVSNYLQYAKKRFRSVLRAVVADTVGGREDLEAELTWLFGAERG